MLNFIHQQNLSMSPKLRIENSISAIFYPSSFPNSENALLSAVIITTKCVYKRPITGCLLSEEQFLSKDNLNRYLELYTERI